MITAEDFRTLGFQTVIFTPGLQFRPNRVLADLMSRWAETLNGEPVVLPQIPDAPASVPRLILKSADSKHRVQVGPNRLDLFWDARTATDSLDIASYLQWSTEVFSHYLEITRGIVGRVAAIIKRAAMDNAPAMTLSRHFCRERWLAGPLNRPSDFELHAHKHFDLLSSFRVNSWFRCKTAKVGEDDQSAIFVEQDFNTLAEELQTREYGPEQIRSFFSLALLEEFNKVLDLYFPKEQA